MYGLTKTEEYQTCVSKHYKLQHALAKVAVKINSEIQVGV